MSQSTPTQPSLSIDAMFRINEICTAFEAAWAGGQSPSLESYLEQVNPAERAPLLRHLLAVELEYRRGRGEVRSQEEYLPRFPKDAEAVVAAFRQAEQSAPTA